MGTVNLYEAKTNLSQLVERASRGEEIVIAKAGRPLARLVPLAKRTSPRPLGRLKFPLDRFDDIMRRTGFDALPILPAHAIAAGGLPRHHDNPFDRVLIAPAKVEALTLASRDQTVARYDVRIFGGAG